MKKLLIFLTILLLPKVSVASNPTQGMCGPAAYWSYDSSTHILKITGQGVTWGYTGNDTPWRKLVGEIHEVIIEGYMQELGNYLFWNCYNLTKVTIPSSVTTICNDVFGNCTKLSDVYCYAENVPSTWSAVFYNVNLQNATLHVPNASIDSYKNTEPWSGFGLIVGLNDTEYKLTYILDGNEYKSYFLFEGQEIIPELSPEKEGYTFSGWSDIPETMPAHDVTVTGSFTINKYKLIYKVDGVDYKSYEIEYGATITPEAAPTKEGYTFSGWSNIPETMPAHDVTVTGSFTINKYKLMYEVDGEVYKSYDVEYGAMLTPEPAPTKEGYTFSGWSEIPTTMPAHDVTVTGSFTKGTYKLIYVVDGETYKTVSYDYGASITPEPAPTREGYTFSGWSEIPEIMPAHDVTINGSFAINKYKLLYKVDGIDYKFYEIEYGAAITPEPEPTKEGYTFSGWSWIPTKMPAEDVTVTGTFAVNKYKLTYKVDGEVYKTYVIEFGASITPEDEPTKEGYTFSGWSWIPSKMPAEDVTITGSFTINQYTITYMIDDEVYQTVKVDYNSKITPPTPPEKEGYDFAWGEYPETMPAHDITITGTYTTGIMPIEMESGNAKIFTLEGKQVELPKKGVNIVRMNNGSVKKVVVK